MTKEEALQAMKEGHKVAHRYFSDDEWVAIDGNKLLTEDGYRHNPDIFWLFRNTPQWDDGWNIFISKGSTDSTEDIAVRFAMYMSGKCTVADQQFFRETFKKKGYWINHKIDN